MYNLSLYCTMKSGISGINECTRVSRVTIHIHVIVQLTEWSIRIDKTGTRANVTRQQQRPAHGHLPMLNIKHQYRIDLVATSSKTTRQRRSRADLPLYLGRNARNSRFFFLFFINRFLTSGRTNETWRKLSFYFSFLIRKRSTMLY